MRMNRQHEKLMVGVIGFEPTTSCSQSKRATGLRHTPTEATSESAIIPRRSPYNNLDLARVFHGWPAASKEVASGGLANHFGSIVFCHALEWVRGLASGGRSGGGYINRDQGDE